MHAATVFGIYGVRVLSILVVFCWGFSAKADTPWQVGVATVKITPEKPVWMAGYAGRKGPSEGVVGDLFAKAMAIQDGQGQRIVIVTTDLIGIPRKLREQLEVEVKEKFQLGRENLWLNASHTHCGPELRLDRIPPAEGSPAEFEQRMELAVEYTTKLHQQLLEVIGQSLKDLKPAKLDYLQARCGFAMNRRRPTAQGVTNAPHADGPVNHKVPVLQITHPDGKLRALLFGYACHNTTMGFKQISGDYAGFAQKYIEAATKALRPCSSQVVGAIRTHTLAAKWNTSIITVAPWRMPSKPLCKRSPSRLTVR